MKKKIFISAVIVFLTVSLIEAKAQRCNDPGSMAKRHGNMMMPGMERMGACNPELIEKRKEFNSELSKEEQMVISEFRERLPMIMEDLSVKRQQFREECNGEPAQRMRTEMQNVFAPVIDIAGNHSTSIELIAKEHFQKRAQAGMNAGKGNKYGRGGDGKGNGTVRGMGKGNGRNEMGSMQGKHHRMMNREDAGNMFAVHFLLLDADKSESAAITSDRIFEVMPNPSTTSNTINYEVLSKGNVKIELLDKEGFVIRTVMETTKEKGTHSLEVNISDLQQNLYFYRITDNSGTNSVKFIVVR